MPENRTKARAITPDELERYQRGPGGPEEQPPGLKEVMVEKLNDLTLAFRNKAKAIARREIFAMEDRGVSRNDTRLQALNAQFNMIAKGGIRGALEAYKIIRAYAGEAPGADSRALR